MRIALSGRTWWLGVAAVCALAGASGVTAATEQPSSVEAILGRTVSSKAAPQLAAAMANDIRGGASLIRPIAEGEFEQEDKDRVNVGRAVGMSVLLPGAGQWYAGRPGRAGVFLGVEVATWSAFGYFLTVKSQKEDDYRLYARVHAGIDPSGKSDEFYRTLTFYDSREQFNEEGRLVDATRPYYPDTPEWHWLWDSKASREQYRSMRNQSNEAESRAKFTLGIALLNRLVSAVDAWRTARAINREARMETAQWKVRVKGKPNLDNPSVSIVFSRPLN